MPQQKKSTRNSAKKTKKRSSHSEINAPPALVVDKPPSNDEKKREEKHSPRDWASLPPEIVCLILSNLDVAEEVIFCSIQKAWRSATLLSPFQYRSRPWLIYYLRTNDSWRFVNPFHRMHIDVPVPLELRGSKIRCCSTDGRLLLERYNNNLCLFNPLTKEIIRLPQTPESGTMDFPSISFDLENHLVVGLHYHHSSGCIAIWKLGKQEWEIHTVQHATLFFQLKGHMVSHKGKFYCVAANGGLAVFSTRNVEESWRVWDTAIRGNNPVWSYAMSYLVESNGGLLGVFETWDGNVEVYRLNKRMRAWEQVKNVGRNQILFLSYGSCFSKVSNVRGLCNSIYFPKFARPNDSSSYLFYSPTTNKFSSLNGEFSTSNACGVRDIRDSCWFVPVPQGGDKCRSSSASTIITSYHLVSFII